MLLLKTIEIISLKVQRKMSKINFEGKYLVKSAKQNVVTSKINFEGK